MHALKAVALLAPTLAFAANYEVPLNEIDEEDDVVTLEERGDISTETADILLDLLRDGVDLNSASRDELYDLPGISYSDADAILLYRKNKGRIEDPTELVGAGAITDQQLILIAPFIRLDAGPTRFPVSAKARAISAMSNGDFLTTGGVTPPPALLFGKGKFPFDLTGGFTLETTRRLTGPPRYDPVRSPTLESLVVDNFDYRAHVPSAWGMWKTGNRKLVAGNFTIGFAERLTLDNTKRYTPSGIYLTDTWRRPRDASRTCRLSSSDPLGGCANGDKDTYLTPDFQEVTRTFRGVAGSIEDLELGDTAKMSFYGFLSYQTRDIYQYELYERLDAAGIPICADPRTQVLNGNGTPTDDPNCRAPPVYVVRNNNLDPLDTKLIYSRLPEVYDELASGGHVDFKPNERYRIGLTGFGATNFFHGLPIRLDTQEWSKEPFGGPYGAIGLDGRAQFGNFGLFIEATRTFDSIKAGPVSPNVVTPAAGGGGYGIEQRTVFSPRGHELELSLRYYDNKFGDPFARAISAPDELDGQSVRNEAGVRLKYKGKLPADFEVRLKGDFWVLPFSNPRKGPAGTANLYAVLRFDYLGYQAVQPSVWFDMRNKNLASSVHGACAPGTVLLVAGDAFTCSGDSYRIAARVDFRPLGRRLSGALQASITFKDDLAYFPAGEADLAQVEFEPAARQALLERNRFRTDAQIWFELRSQLTDWLRLRTRTRYLHEDFGFKPTPAGQTDFGCYGGFIPLLTSSGDPNPKLPVLGCHERSVWAFLEATYIYSRNFKFSLRYDLYAFLDKRGISLTRVPNPEHRFFVDISAGF